MSKRRKTKADRERAAYWNARHNKMWAEINERAANPQPPVKSDAQKLIDSGMTVPYKREGSES